MYPLYQIIASLKFDKLISFILRDKLRIVMYHGIIPDDTDLDCWWLIKRKRFTDQISYLADNFNIISIDEAIGLNCLPENPCVITFDDGYKSVLTHAYPVLSKMGIPFTVYVTTGPVEKRSLLWPDNVYTYLYSKNIDEIDLSIPGFDNSFLSSQSKTDYINGSLKVLKQMEYNEKNTFIDKFIKKQYISAERWQSVNSPFEMLAIDDIKKLANDPLVTIGAHTVNHEILTRMPLPAAAKEIENSHKALENWTGKKISHFAYPDGQYNKQLAKLVKELGFKSAVRIGLLINWNINKYELCRIGTGSGDDDYEFRAMVNGIISLKIEVRNFIRKILAVS